MEKGCDCAAKTRTGFRPVCGPLEENSEQTIFSPLFLFSHYICQGRGWLISDAVLLQRHLASHYVGVKLQIANRQMLKIEFLQLSLVGFKLAAIGPKHIFYS